MPESPTRHDTEHSLVICSMVTDTTRHRAATAEAISAANAAPSTAPVVSSPHPTRVPRPAHGRGDRRWVVSYGSTHTGSPMVACSGFLVWRRSRSRLVLMDGDAVVIDARFTVAGERIAPGVVVNLYGHWVRVGDETPCSPIRAVDSSRIDRDPPSSGMDFVVPPLNEQLVDAAPSFAHRYSRGDRSSERSSRWLVNFSRSSNLGEDGTRKGVLVKGVVDSRLMLFDDFGVMVAERESDVGKKSLLLYCSW